MPLLKSWVVSANAPDHPFPLNNLPYGSFLTEEGEGNRSIARFPWPQSYEDVLNMIAALLNEEHQYNADGNDFSVADTIRQDASEQG